VSVNDTPSSTRPDKKRGPGDRSGPGKLVRFVRFTAAATVGAVFVVIGHALLPIDDFPWFDDFPTIESNAKHAEREGQAKLADRDGLRTVNVAGGRIDLVYQADDFDVPAETLAKWIHQSAVATSTYFGRFPVRRVVIRLRAVDGDDVTGGSATAAPDPRITINIGRRTSARTLLADSTAVHEMTHLAIPDHAERHLWFHEGIATYVETIARAQSGLISPEVAWGELAYGMSSGVAEGGDERGLDDTEIWDRRYWGGAIFFLMADVEIRQRTSGRLGLQDALRGLQSGGGDLSSHWEFSRILRTADDVVGADVLQSLYRRMARGGASGRIDGDTLAQVWRDLGVVPTTRRSVRLDDGAPLAAARLAIIAKPSAPLLVEAPRKVLEGRTRQARTSSWPVLMRQPEAVR